MGAPNAPVHARSERCQRTCRDPPAAGQLGRRCDPAPDRTVRSSMGRPPVPIRCSAARIGRPAWPRVARMFPPFPARPRRDGPCVGRTSREGGEPARRRPAAGLGEGGGACRNADLPRRLNDACRVFGMSRWPFGLGPPRVPRRVALGAKSFVEDRPEGSVVPPARRRPAGSAARAQAPSSTSPATRSECQAVQRGAMRWPRPATCLAERAAPTRALRSPRRGRRPSGGAIRPPRPGPTGRDRAGRSAHGSRSARPPRAPAPRPTGRRVLAEAHQAERRARRRTDSFRRSGAVRTRADRERVRPRSVWV